MQELKHQQATKTYEYAGTKTVEEEPDLQAQPCCGARVEFIYHYLGEGAPDPAEIQTRLSRTTSKAERDAIDLEVREAALYELYPVAQCPACDATYHACPIITYEIKALDADELDRLRKLTGFDPSTGRDSPAQNHYRFFEL